MRGGRAGEGQGMGGERGREGQGNEVSYVQYSSTIHQT